MLLDKSVSFKVFETPAIYENTIINRILF